MKRAADVEVTEVRAPVGYSTAFLCTEIADHFAIVSGGAGTRLVLATTDGKTWHRRPSPRANGLRGVRIMGEEMWVVGEYGTCAVSTDRGEHWEVVNTGTGECLWDIIRDDKGRLWIAGTGAIVLRAKDRAFRKVAHSLKPRDDRADPRIEHVGVGIFFTVFAAYWDGKRFVKARGVKGQISALAVSPAGTVVLVGDDGVAFRSTDGGASFRRVDGGVTAHLNDVAYVAGGFVAVGDKGVMRRSTDDGVTWRPVKSGTKTQLWSIASWGGGAFVGGDASIVLRIDSPGDTYWDGCNDELAPKAVVPVAGFTPLAAPTPAQRDARHAELFAAALAAHAEISAGVPRRFSSEALDAAILADPDDDEAYLVYGDWLQSRGDVRGELIALAYGVHIAGDPVKAFLAKHAAALVGELASHDVLELAWHMGFIARARVANAYDDDADDMDRYWRRSVEQALAALLGHPSARFLRELEVAIATSAANTHVGVVAELAAGQLPVLRKLVLGGYATDGLGDTRLGALAKLYAAVPRLESLELRSGPKLELGEIVLPHLRELVIVTGGLSKQALQSVIAGQLPSLERLSLYLGAPSLGTEVTLRDLEPLLSTDRFPRLGHLGLCNSELADRLCARLPTAAVLPQLASLDLSRSTLSDTGARTIAAYASAFRHLEKLDISFDYVSEEAIALLERALPTTQVLTDRQRSADAGEERYVMTG